MRKILSGVVGAGAVLAAGCSDAVTPVGPAASLERGASAAGDYIVVFRDDVPDAPGLARRLAAGFGASPRFTYEHAIKGFAATLPEQAAAALAHNPNVAYVEPDGIAYASTTQTGATWGIDRIDQRNKVGTTAGSFIYTNTGKDVTAYIIDTGIRFSHSEFGGRASFGFDAFGGDGSDCNGHGTHVAGTVGGTVYGVAKAVTLKAVRVLDCGGSGTWGGVIDGIDWVVEHHAAGAPAVANLSLGGGASTAVDDAVRRLVADGVTTAVAAGNGNAAGIPQNACNYSPARVAEAITVGSTTKSDTESSFSNYGTCVDILAPGSGITSAWKDNDTQTHTISGTSMATPHVAGVAALLLQGAPAASPAVVWDGTATTNGLKDVATADAISLSRNSKRYGTPNRLLFTDY